MDDLPAKEFVLSNSALHECEWIHHKQGDLPVHFVSLTYLERWSYPGGRVIESSMAPKGSDSGDSERGPRGVDNGLGSPVVRKIGSAWWIHLFLVGLVCS